MEALIKPVQGFIRRTQDGWGSRRQYLPPIFHSQGRLGSPVGCREKWRHIRLKTAHDNNDWTAIRNTAHKIKGGASYCAAMPLKEACARLEASAKIDDIELLEALYKQLLAEIFLAEKVIKEKLRLG